MKHILLILFIAVCSIACKSLQPVAPSSNTKHVIQQTLDSFHRAASVANIEAYFNFFTPDAVFLGSDPDEHWSRDAFRTWAAPFFARGKAWSFTALERHVYLGPHNTAWFDELLDAPFAGIARGSGVLIHTKQGWRISQYVLSMSIPNAVGDSVKHLKAPLEKAWRQQHPTF